MSQLLGCHSAVRCYLEDDLQVARQALGGDHMNTWKTRMLILLILVLLFGIGYRNIVTQATNLREQPLPQELSSTSTSLGKLQFQIEGADAVALSASMFTLQLIPEIDSNPTVSKLDLLDNNKSLSDQTHVSVTLNMLSMDCGTIHFTMIPDDQGIYYGEGIPVMSGLWVAIATVTYEDQPQDEPIQLAFTFDVQ